MEEAYPIVTTDAFVLYTKPSKESDRFVTCLTEKYGVITVYARGIRKEKAKLRNSLIPYRYVSLSFVNGKTRTLTDINVKDQLKNIWSDKEIYTNYVTLLKTIYTIVPADLNSDVAIFNTLKETTIYFEKGSKEDAEKILLASHTLIFMHLGYINNTKTFQELLSSMRSNKNLEVVLQKEINKAFNCCF